MLERLFNNWSLKLLALCIAVAMWLFVAGQEKTELTIQVPVELVNIPPDAVVVGDLAGEVKARINGPSNLVRRAAEQRLVKRVDLKGMGMGEHVYRLVPKDLLLPPGVEVVRVSPANFTVKLARKVSRKIRVSGSVEGKPAEGLEVADINFKPPSVVVFGSEKDLEGLDWIWAVPIKVDGLKEDRTYKVGLKLPKGRSLQMETRDVEATVKLRPIGVKDEKKPEAKQKAPPGKAVP